MSLFHELERRIDQKLRGFLRSGAQQHGKEIIETQRYILDQIAERVQNLPRARRVFPFNEVVVRIPVPDPELRAGWEMVFVSDSALEHDVREYLARDGVEFPADLSVQAALFETAEITEPSIVCRNREKGTQAAGPGSAADKPPVIRITVLGNGNSVEIGKARIHLGRLPEILDQQKRPVRRNDVSVDDATVSRAHAHIDWDPASGDYRIFDDGSSYGTGVLHEGVLIKVPAGVSRGIRLHPSDEIYLGQARLRIEAAG